MLKCNVTIPLIREKISKKILIALIAVAVIGYYYHKKKAAVTDAFARGNMDRDLAHYNNDIAVNKLGLCKTTSGTVTRNCGPRKTITLAPAQKTGDLG
jgi:hypothetical protein